MIHCGSILMPAAAWHKAEVIEVCARTRDEVMSAAISVIGGDPRIRPGESVYVAISPVPETFPALAWVLKLQQEGF